MDQRTGRTLTLKMLCAKIMLGFPKKYHGMRKKFNSDTKRCFKRYLSL